MGTYKLSPEASRDLDQITDYIIEDKPARAVSFIDELAERFKAIGDFPNALGHREDLPSAWRAAVHGNYRISYMIEDEIPVILRVFHAARDTFGLNI